MQLKSGEKLKRIILPAIDGSVFDTDVIQGKPLLLSFLRFASCPFCNLRVNELVTRFNELADDFAVVIVFDSPLDNLIKHAEGHNAPFVILADENNEYYQKYAIENSILGVLKGMLFRFPTLLKGMFKGYFPTTIKGNITTMPADFLIDRDGVIQTAYYGRDEGDHLEFSTIKEFSQSVQ